MKNTNLLLCLLFCLITSTVFAQSSSRFEQALQTSIQELNGAKSVDALQQVANTLERISQAEKEEWLPAYYLGFTYLQIAERSKKKEAGRYLELSQQQLDKLLELAPKNSEVHTLQGYKYMLFVAAEPANRGAEYTPRTLEAFQRAIALNANNPRAFLLMGQMQLGMAKFFGSSNAEACGLLQRAGQLFEQEKEDALLPRWGKEAAVATARMCQDPQAKKE